MRMRTRGKTKSRTMEDERKGKAGLVLELLGLLREVRGQSDDVYALAETPFGHIAYDDLVCYALTKTLSFKGVASYCQRRREILAKKSIHTGLGAKLKAGQMSKESKELDPFRQKDPAYRNDVFVRFFFGNNNQEVMWVTVEDFDEEKKHGHGFLLNESVLDDRLRPGVVVNFRLAKNNGKPFLMAV